MLYVVGILVLVVLAFFHGATALLSNVYPLSLLDDGAGNEALIIEGRVCDERVLFLVDTAYAGAPVLSVSYMNCIRKNPRLTLGSVRTRFWATMQALEAEMTNYEMHETLNEYVGRGACKTFTSGCTMRLMGIGETSEAQSEMLLCPPIALAGRKKWRWDADVFVTNPLPGSPHILTSDYLLHNGPALIEPAKGRLSLRASVRRHDFDLFEAHLVGGAFLIPIEVSGVVMNVVVDTGASTTLSLAPSSASRLRARGGCRLRNRKVFQTGVNGENICSDVVSLDVTVGGTALPAVDVLVNSQEVEGADGYVGIGILRAFDLYLSREAIGVRPSGLSPSTLTAPLEGRCAASVACEA
jgi:hypothetical protein